MKFKAPKQPSSHSGQIPCHAFRKGIRVWGLGFRFRVYGSGFRVQGLELNVQGLGLRVAVKELKLGYYNKG